MRLALPDLAAMDAWGRKLADALLPGDVTRPGLGVAMLPPLDLIIHSAAVTVFDAICKRAAAAQQLLNCVTEVYFAEGREIALERDAYFAAHGKVMGPLHGVRTVDDAVDELC